MSDEVKELMARIGQVAGILRHLAAISFNLGFSLPQVVTQFPHDVRIAFILWKSLALLTNTDNIYRHAVAPYPQRGHRTGRAPTAHRHRTLDLTTTRTSSPSSNSGAGSASESSGWVSRTDRHRQLINASVYEKESQTRAKAMEETRLRNMGDKRRRERSQFTAFLKSQTGTYGANPQAENSTGTNELLIQGIRFRVMDGGKKLMKLHDDPHPASATPKTTVIAGVKFNRTKTGNLVANRIVQDQRYGLGFSTLRVLTQYSQSGKFKKVDQRCKIFSTTVALCKDFLKDGRCSRGDSCDLAHELTPERMPDCLHYAKGHCAKADCAYTHSKSPPSAPVCRDFGFCGFCDKGANCSERHVFECPDFTNTGRCRVKGCKLPHRERASLLRNQAKADEMNEDVSSEDEAADSDDVDSDEVAEFIEVDSDDPDAEGTRDYLPI
ncbi:hypothetical protein S40293_09021 [Stachybotrys chartarum IBT 40293]|nr:hypothetical protein S40293_09021 [Stachybotrys chartarum IBT 40293]